jgi:hypothetical protein
LSNSLLFIAQCAALMMVSELDALCGRRAENHAKQVSQLASWQRVEHETPVQSPKSANRRREKQTTQLSQFYRANDISPLQSLAGRASKKGTSTTVNTMPRP